MVNHILTIFEEKWQHFLRSIISKNDQKDIGIMGINKTHHNTVVMQFLANGDDNWGSKLFAHRSRHFRSPPTHAFLHEKIKKKHKKIDKIMNYNILKNLRRRVSFLRS